MSELPNLNESFYQFCQLLGLITDILIPLGYVVLRDFLKTIK